MVRGIYTGASGMVAQMHRMDTLTNNLANVDLTGYKRDTAVHKAFPELLIRRINDNGTYKFPFGSMEVGPVVGTLGTGVEMNESYTDFTQGALKQTDNPFDLSLDGKGFFTVLTPDGERYTRNGTFHLGPEGYLVTKDGYPVLGEEGPVQLKMNNFVVDRQGRIFQNADLASDPDRLVSLEENEWGNVELVDSLKIVDFTRDRYLKKQGNSLWRDTVESGMPVAFAENQGPRVVQGFTEAANVNPVQEMVQLIEVNRAYEANQKMIESHDTLSGKLINDAVKV